jgi:hypothetical protein
LVEAAVVLPLALFLLFGLVVGGFGIYRYNQIAHLARETARFASVHGGQYAKQNADAIAAGSLPAVDKDYLVKKVAQANAVGLDVSQMQVSVQMTVITPNSTSPATTETVDWDNTVQNLNRSPYSAWTDNSATPPANVEVSNMVTVTVTYQWMPELFLVGPFNLSSTAVMPMSY